MSNLNNELKQVERKLNRNTILVLLASILFAVAIVLKTNNWIQEYTLLGLLVLIILMIATGLVNGLQLMNKQSKLASQIKFQEMMSYLN